MRYNQGQKLIDFADQAPAPKEKLKYGEFFAGGLGCASRAKKNKDIDVRWVLNHDKVAVNTAYFHLPGTKVYWADIYNQDEHELEWVNWIQGSFECDMFSDANAGNEIDVQSYMMGWELYRFMTFLLPDVLTVENVTGVKKWSPLDENNKPIKEREGEEFNRWKAAIMALGYEYTESVRCAADDGIPTTRTRYFAAFHRPGIDFTFPDYTHNEYGTDGLLPWVPCRDFLDLNNHGNSIFGREYNKSIPKQYRKPLVVNSLKRIASGIKKEAPELYQFIATYYGGVQGQNRTQSLDKPLATQTADGNRHQLVTVNSLSTEQLIAIEKVQFIADHCMSDNFQSIKKPLKSQTSQQTKRFVTIEQLLVQYYGGSDQSHGVDKPLNTQPCRDVHQLVTIEKQQFIAHYFNSGGNPGSNVQSINKPINSLTTNNQAQLVTCLEGFDIKARFLNKEELAEITTFPRDFFSRPGLKVSHKDAIKMIGNAVPPKWFDKVILKPNIDAVIQYNNKRQSA